jgi:hypothetical protein
LQRNMQTIIPEITCPEAGANVLGVGKAEPKTPAALMEPAVFGGLAEIII